MQKRKISYTKLGIMSAITFLIIVILFEFLLSLTSKNDIGTITNNMLSIKYIGTKLLLAVLYGFFMVFLFKRKEKKINNAQKKR